MEVVEEEAKTYRFYGRKDGSLVFLHRSTSNYS